MNVGPLAPSLAGLVAGAALLIGALIAYARWQRSGDLLALLVSAFAAGLAGLARPELFIVSGTLAGVVMFAPLPAARRASRRREQHLAIVLAYAAAVLGVLGLWLLVTFVLANGAVAAVAGP